MALLLLLLALVLVAGAVLVGARLTQPAPVDLGIFEPVAGRIVFGDDDGIWAIDPAAPADSATRVQLTAQAGIPLGWSSDGTRLVIVRRSGGEEQLFVLHANGSETDLNDAPTSVRGWNPWPHQATISPDGSRVVFRGGFRAPGGGCCNWGLFAVDADGGPVEMLVESRMGVVGTPTFSPDGSQIAYVEAAGADGD
jgi:Tol biopolymer transport system component